jgi:hypothetical protein
LLTVSNGGLSIPSRLKSLQGCDYLTPNSYDAIWLQPVFPSAASSLTELALSSQYSTDFRDKLRNWFPTAEMIHEV